ncbi:hypothetical protein HMPREF1632_02475 [Mageeibacillus indolicus 0009-5]|nr:hypothetical protein HMPREF1632_02475 [Mageeibacillus indolicus 0009-5]
MMKKNKTDVSMKADNSIDPGAKAQTEQAAEVEMETKTVEPGADTVDRTTTECDKAGTAEKNIDLAEEIKKLSAENAKLTQKLAARDKEYVSLAAEYDNFRKRSKKEKENLYKDSVKDVAEAWLPLVDDLGRAVAAAEAMSEKVDKSVMDGIILIQKRAEQILASLKIKEINALGEKFDPNLHNAVMQTTDETKGEQEIVEVFQKGYTYDDRVIRHSVVKVAN